MLIHWQFVSPHALVVELAYLLVGEAKVQPLPGLNLRREARASQRFREEVSRLISLFKLIHAPIALTTAGEESRLVIHLGEDTGRIEDMAGHAEREEVRTSLDGLFALEFTKLASDNYTVLKSRIEDNRRSLREGGCLEGAVDDDPL